MEIDALWEGLRVHMIAQDHYVGRWFVTIAKSDFDQYLSEFQESYNPFNRQINYRSHQMFTHIHAVVDGEYVQFHKDYYNPDANILLSIPHFFRSVVPYFIWCLVSGRKLYSAHI